MKLALRNRFLLAFLTVAMPVLAVMCSSAFGQPLVSNHLAARVGLERAWFAQVRVNPAEHKVVHWVLDGEQLYALTSAGTIQSIDAQTGETLWSNEVGSGHTAAVGMAVDSKYVALLGPSRLYVLDRADGHHIWSRRIGGAASAAPALSEKYAYVTLLSGRIEGYRLDNPEANVWQYQSYGHTFESPTATGRVVSWPSDRGMLYVGDAESPRVLFRVESNDEIVAPPAEKDPYLYVASLDGYLYCFHELSGSEQWRYATGFAVTSQPAVVEELAFVASEGPALHAVNAVTGAGLWSVGGVKQFVALAERHTYGMDRYGTLVVIDNETGSVTGRLATGASNSALVNDKSDRIFLINDRGLVQCLHEIGADKPTMHREMPSHEAMADSDVEVDGTEAVDAEAAGASEAADSSPFEADEPATNDESGFDNEEDDSNPFSF